MSSYGLKNGYQVDLTFNTWWLGVRMHYCVGHRTDSTVGGLKGVRVRSIWWAGGSSVTNFVQN
jgi:hypothetical protein